MEDLGFGDPQSQKRTAGKAVHPVDLQHVETTILYNVFY